MRHSFAHGLALLGVLVMPLACGKSEAPPEAKPLPAKSATPVAATPPSATAAPAPTGGLGGLGGLGGNAPLFHPEKATEKAPDKFKAKFSTTKGDFTIEVTRAWAPAGADRFYNLIKLGYYDETRFFRAVDGFMVQWGIHGDPRVNGAWSRAYIPDDPVVKSNTRGFVTFATSGKDRRGTQVFISYVDKNARLDKSGFSPFGEVVDGMKVVDSLHKGYGDGPPSGKGPEQSRIQSEGNTYLNTEFPKLDSIKEAKIL
jgi:peptidyl-prolyl cis-trans isomerase A (cyclophilin A)